MKWIRVKRTESDRKSMSDNLILELLALRLIRMLKSGVSDEGLIELIDTKKDLFIDLIIDGLKESIWVLEMCLIRLKKMLPNITIQTDLEHIDLIEFLHSIGFYRLTIRYEKEKTSVTIHNVLVKDRARIKKIKAYLQKRQNLYWILLEEYECTMKQRQLKTLRETKERLQREKHQSLPVCEFCNNNFEPDIVYYVNSNRLVCSKLCRDSFNQVLKPDN